ncbi:ABC transporter permease [Roseibium aquae]|uniref:ABC transporter permease n=1 Tax=Roseibium aquae TaxID=1323746 RepID=A0A916TE38_9HYPH|nr:thiol reductant ABC exporter subunit CydC [Roseibium aquae]GGB41560.1 ABC transporter permease [Roseibium aquae]
MSGLAKIVAWQWSHNRGGFALGLLVALVPALSGLALLGVAGWFITAAAIAGASGAFLNIFAPSALIRGLAITRTAGRYGERILTHDATFRFLTDLRGRLFRGLSVRALLRPGTVRSALVLNRLTSDLASLDTVYLRLVVPAVVAGGALLVVSLVYLINLPAGLTLVGGLCAALIVAVLQLLRRADAKGARRQEAASDAVRTRSIDLVSGRRDLAVYGGLAPAKERVEAAADRLLRTEAGQERRAARFVAATSLIGQAFTASLLLLVVMATLAGTLPVAVAAGLVLMALALPELLTGLVPGLIALPRTRLAARRVVPAASTDGLFDAVFGGAETPGPGPVPGMRPTREDTEDATCVLAFDRVSFAYPGAKAPVLDGLDLQIRAGEVVALVGRSGCGKSTVSALAAGLLTADAGEIRLCGTPLADLPEAALRRCVTVLSQRPYLFHDTVAANLRIARPDASDDQLWAVLEQAALWQQIRSRPEGLQTVLGEGGLGLSGGEKRRLGLARAFLTDPALWILDEVTEGLDEQTGEDVLRRFFARRGGSPVLMIAHKDREISRAHRTVAI